MTELPPEWHRVQIRGISFEPDGATVLEYCIPAKDARANGVVLNHILRIPYGDQYDDEIDAVTDAALLLINDVLEDLPHLDPIQLRADGDAGDDDDD